MTEIIAFGETYPVIQINGQRIIGPCKHWYKFNRKPDDEKEIFISGIPKYMTEHELVPIFCRIGPIWKFRLMMNFSGHNRGFAYVQYIFTEHHERALLLFKNLIIHPGGIIKLSISRNVRTLVIYGITPTLIYKDLCDEIKSVVNVNKIEIGPKHKCGMSLQLTFHSHRDAALSRRMLLSILPKFGPSSWVRWL